MFSDDRHLGIRKAGERIQLLQVDDNLRTLNVNEVKSIIGYGSCFVDLTGFEAKGPAPNKGGEDAAGEERAVAARHPEDLVQ